MSTLPNLYYYYFSKSFYTLHYSINILLFLLPYFMKTEKIIMRFIKFFHSFNKKMETFKITKDQKCVVCTDLICSLNARAIAVRRRKAFKAWVEACSLRLTRNSRWSYTHNSSLTHRISRVSRLFCRFLLTNSFFPFLIINEHKISTTKVTTLLSLFAHSPLPNSSLSLADTFLSLLFVTLLIR